MGTGEVAGRSTGRLSPRTLPDLLDVYSTFCIHLTLPPAYRGSYWRACQCVYVCVRVCTCVCARLSLGLSSRIPRYSEKLSCRVPTSPRKGGT